MCMIGFIFVCILKSGAKLQLFLHFHSIISAIIIVIFEWKIKKPFSENSALIFFGCSTATIIGRNNIMLPTRPVEFIWGTKTPLIFSRNADFQWGYSFCCQS